MSKNYLNKVFFIFLMFSLKCYSYEGFRCIPSVKDSRIEFLIQDDEIRVLVTNPSGYDFMPQIEGSLSKFDLKSAVQQVEDLNNLGQQFMFKWKKSECQLDIKNFLVHCGVSAKNEINGIKSYGLTTTEINEKYQNTNFEKRRFRLSLEKENIYFISLSFFKNQCLAFN